MTSELHPPNYPTCTCDNCVSLAMEDQANEVTRLELVIAFVPAEGVFHTALFNRDNPESGVIMRRLVTEQQDGAFVARTDLNMLHQ